MPQPGATASRAARQISGMVVPWNVYGNTSAGRLAFRPGSIRLPDDLSQVKLVDTHVRPPESVGYAVAAHADDAGLHMTFQLGSTKRATKVLKAAAEHTKDGLSVEVDDLNIDPTALVHDSLLTAVASVPIPAFASARVATVAAAHQGGTMIDCTSCGHRHAPGAACIAPGVQAGNQPQGQALQPGQQATAGQPQGQAPANQGQGQQDPQGGAPAPGPAGPLMVQTPYGPMPVIGGQVQPFPQQGQQLPGFGAPAFVPAPAQVPAMFQAQAAQGTQGQVQAEPSDAEMYAALGRVMQGERITPELEAALSDVINTNVFDVVGAESYVGRLWSGRAYQRRFVPLMRSGNLTSWKVRGWKWNVKPIVQDYAGDKANVPSNSPTVLPAETEAARLAGGHDLDRKFKDFGDTEFISAYLEAMTESYAKQSDLKAYAFLNANATNGDDTAAGGTLLDAFLLATGQVEDLTDGEPADWVIANRADVRALMAVTNNEAPAYLTQLGFDWSKLVATNQHPAGSVIAGVKAASTFYELPGSPIRVEALDIARGGIDEALFGYYATLLHSSIGIVKSTITPEA